MSPPFWPGEIGAFGSAMMPGLDLRDRVRARDECSSALAVIGGGSSDAASAVVAARRPIATPDKRELYIHLTLPGGGGAGAGAGEGAGGWGAGAGAGPGRAGAALPLVATVRLALTDLPSTRAENAMSNLPASAKKVVLNTPGAVGAARGHARATRSGPSR